MTDDTDPQPLADEELLTLPAERRRDLLINLIAELFPDVKAAHLSLLFAADSPTAKAQMSQMRQGFIARAVPTEERDAAEHVARGADFLMQGHVGAVLDVAELLPLAHRAFEVRFQRQIEREAKVRALAAMAPANDEEQPI